MQLGNLHTQLLAVFPPASVSNRLRSEQSFDIRQAWGDVRQRAPRTRVAYATASHVQAYPGPLGRGVDGFGLPDADPYGDCRNSSNPFTPTIDLLKIFLNS
jgi:hypothetical protein